MEDTAKVAGRTQAEVVRDPVCGMTVNLDRNSRTHEYGGHIYHFCSDGCRTKFAASPEDYVEAVDPVCGMKVNRAAAQHMAKHAGERFYFCSDRYRGKF